jgi:penicillin-binding protein 1A
MNNMTGGSLPARTWKEIMAFAHQGIELKNPYGVTDAPARPVHVAAHPNGPGDLGQPQRPAVLSKKSAETLTSIEALFSSAAPRRTTAADNDRARRSAVLVGGRTSAHGAAVD